MSGKVARRLRKKQAFTKPIFSKKTLALCAGLCLSCAPIVADSEFLVSLYPHFTKPFGEAHDIKYGIGGGTRFTWRPLKVLNVFANGDYLSMALPGVDPISILNGGLGAGYHLEVNDRIGLDFNANGGVYRAKAVQAISGFSGGITVSFSYRINPIISADVNASGTHFASGSKPLMMVNAAISPGVTFNMTEVFNSKARIEMQTKSLDPVFPVLYSWYEDNSFGEVEITNKEENTITDITVSFYQPQYMSHPMECSKINRLKPDDSANVQLYSYFNEQILELTEKAETKSYVIVDYLCLGQKRSKKFAMDVQVYGRNNMSWDDDRRAAVFVSSKDPAAMHFARYVTSVVREKKRDDVPLNIQYAMGIFEALDQVGLNYVVDPLSAFEDNVGTSSIDFLQFPYQTLMYRGGDCDDLSILVCSLFEAVGIKTAFITIPGHIYMAFDSGLTQEQGRERLKSLDGYIVSNDELWVPLEITLTDEGFYKAWRVGAREWTTARDQNKAAFYRMSDSWKIYQPISVPGAVSYLNMPEDEPLAVDFKRTVDLWSASELRDITAGPKLQLVMNQKEAEESEETGTVIKSNPFSDSALRDVLVMAGEVAALPLPVAIREEELDEEFGEEITKNELETFNEFDEGDEADEDTRTRQWAEPKNDVFVAESLETSSGVFTAQAQSRTKPEVLDDDLQEIQTAAVLTETAMAVPEEKHKKSEAAGTAAKIVVSVTAATAAVGLFIFAKKKKKGEEQG